MFKVKKRRENVNRNYKYIVALGSHLEIQNQERNLIPGPITSDLWCHIIKKGVYEKFWIPRPSSHLVVFPWSPINEFDVPKMLILDFTEMQWGSVKMICGHKLYTLFADYLLQYNYDQLFLFSHIQIITVNFFA